MTADRNELARRVYAGETECMPLLYELCSGIIKKAAYSFYKVHESRCLSAGITVEDLISVGYFALLEAVWAYNNDTKGYKFLAYLRYPLRNQFNAAIGYRTIRAAREPLNNAVSLNQPPTGDTEDLTLLDTIGDRESSGAYDEVIDGMAMAGVFPEVQHMLEDYPERYAVLVKFYKEGKPVARVADDTGLTAVQVSNAKAAAHEQLRRSHKLRQIYLDVIGSSYRRSGFSYWKHTHNSSVEWAAIKREQLHKNGI